MPRPFLLLLSTLLLPVAAQAATKLSDLSSVGKPLAVPQSGDFVFSLLPKAFQRNPTLDMTVNTEVTDFGRLFRAVTPSNPAYYVAQSAGFRQWGSQSGGEKTPPAAELERAMKKSLAANGYLSADEPAQRPSIVLVYYWGSHNKLDRETAANFPELAAKYQLERATLVGGKKYAAQIAYQMEWGSSPADNTTVKEYLRYQAADDLYFVVASAYDYGSAARNEKKLLWRTTMTVNSVGVNMMESITPLIATGAPFFGRETKEPEIAARRISRDGRVEIGESKVINDQVPPESLMPAKPAK
jgi:hypothetical protein